jgi:hypothetical protein
VKQNWWKESVALRRTNPAVDYRSYEPGVKSNAEICSFTSPLPKNRVLPNPDLTGNASLLTSASPIRLDDSELLLSNLAIQPAEDFRPLTLRPLEARDDRLRQP